ncbi:uncharacterized protein F4822DRAFT_427606 [Hypoxylon trugodes]|uniref:uncharacterized protein n=1 Tax=Hypoxylon trugodes TaxID=326681 RepID=UPI002193043D|nr:uncharacterized protein F4822DRAFT_427606 [Hypoxylon trugodes]KAI1389254.1 hypothetical protein F4822DRAFT_427606 [Hypoxylon trugodes]
MAGSSSEVPQDIIQPLRSDQVDPGDNVSVPGPDSPSIHSEQDLHRGNSRVVTYQGRKRRHFSQKFKVNIFSQGGSATGGSATGGSGIINGNGDNSADVGDNSISSLASQVAALTRRVDELSTASTRGVIVETGTWNTISVRPWESPQPHTEGRVNFVKEFKAIPTVMVSLSSADVSNEANFRVGVYATSVDSKGFTAHADSWFNTTLYSCVISWIAIGE